MICDLCPRRCHAARGRQGGEGFCGMGELAVVSRAAVHMWEEPCISGERGSGTIFFAGCPLGCVFCQNLRISKGGEGRAISVGELAALFERVEGLGVHNINLVTPTHFTHAIVKALRLYKPRVPVVWNSGGYERVETLRALRGLVDIYLPDVKYFSADTARELADAPDYFETAMSAVAEMRAQTGAAQYDERGLMTRGTLIRHLVLPLRVNESIAIMDAIKERLPDGTPLSLMRQYTPMAGTDIKGLERRLTSREYRRAVEHMLALGLEGYTQGKEAADAAYTPDFCDAESYALLGG